MLAGKDPDSDLFPVSDGTSSCTQENEYQNIKFGGERKLTVTAVDTKGFNDSSNGIDQVSVANFIAGLRRRSAIVNVFGITIHETRVDGPIVNMMRLFAELFGPEFWHHCILIFTKCSMDRKAINKPAR